MIPQFSIRLISADDIRLAVTSRLTLAISSNFAANSAVNASARPAAIILSPAGMLTGCVAQLGGPANSTVEPFSRSPPDGLMTSWRRKYLGCSGVGEVIIGRQPMPALPPASLQEITMNAIQSRRRFLGVLSAGAASAIAPAAVAAKLEDHTRAAGGRGAWAA
jgi:hypothetical protein